MARERLVDGLTFGTRIRELRGARQLTQREVAAELGINFTYLSKLENDRGGAPSERTVRRLAEVYGADPEELLALAGKVPPELRQRVNEDLDFAELVRVLPMLPPEKLKRIFMVAGVPRRRR